MSACGLGAGASLGACADHVCGFKLGAASSAGRLMGRLSCPSATLPTGRSGCAPPAATRPPLWCGWLGARHRLLWSSHPVRMDAARSRNVSDTNKDWNDFLAFDKPYVFLLFFLPPSPSGWVEQAARKADTPHDGAEKTRLAGLGLSSSSLLGTSTLALPRFTGDELPALLTLDAVAGDAPSRQGTLSLARFCATNSAGRYGAVLWVDCLSETSPCLRTFW